MSFMKKIWKPLTAVGSVAAAPFTGGLSLMGLGALGLGGGGQGNANTKTGDLKSQSEQTLLQTQQKALSTADELTPSARRFMSMGETSISPVVDYWSRILRGNRGEMTSLLAPEVNRIGEGYDTARQTLSTLSPRGGGTSAMMAELPFQQARDVSTLFQTARPMAAQNLLGAGSTSAAIGSDSYGNVLRALTGATSSGASALDSLLQRRAQNLDIGSKIGEAIPEILKMLGVGGKKGG